MNEPLSPAEMAYYDQHRAFLRDHGVNTQAEARKVMGLSMLYLVVMEIAANDQVRDHGVAGMVKALDMMGYTPQELDFARENLKSFMEWTKRFGDDHFPPE